MFKRLCPASLAVGLITAASILNAQTVQYKSPAGVEYRSQKDTGTVARAQKALAANP